MKTCIKGWLLIASVLALQHTTTALESLALHKQGNWTVESDGYKFEGPSSAPPITALQLVAAHTGQDPLYRFGERNYSHVPLQDWLWSCTFDLPPHLSLDRPLQHFLLHFESLDAVGTVVLNGRTLGQVASAHRPFAFYVTDYLSQSGNVLEVTLESPVQHAAKQAAAYPYNVPHTQQKGALPHYNFIRKAASDFGWDWGPAFAPVGVTGGVWLRAFSQPFLAGMSVQQQHNPNKTVTLRVGASLQPIAVQATGTLSASVSDAAGKQLWAAERRITVPGCGPQTCPQYGWDSAALLTMNTMDSENLGSTCNVEDNEVEEPLGGGPLGSCTAAGPLGTAQHSLEVLVTHPFELWWPYEFGAQAMYQLRLSFTPDSNATGSHSEEGPSEEASSLTRRIGFRTVELVREPLMAEGGQTGESFYFRVNGLPLFARGANVVPMDILETRVEAKALRQLVSDAKAAFMNMLRVWGGGRYFQDAFYDACDEAGVLVWQEAMFACGMYPRGAPFLQEVDAEVRYQVGRLSPHPSVALWGGNNENEASFTWFPATLANPHLYAVDYSKLFVDIVRTAVLETDPGVIYLDTSPSNGLISEDPYVKRWGDVADPSLGDVHFYNYHGDMFDPQSYPPAKFVSEFGYMSFPSFSEYKKVTEPEDWALGSEMTDFRLRHANGVDELLAQFQRHFLPDPKTVAAFGGRSSSSAHGEGPLGTLRFQNRAANAAAAGTAGAEEEFKAFVYLSQVQQALAYETAIGRWRRLKADPSARTYGVLYWQLNDIWQGPSWSGLDFGGGWKLLHHAAQGFFAPVAVSGEVDREAGAVLVHLTNDLSVGVEGTMTIHAIPYLAVSPTNITRVANATRLLAAPFSGGAVWAASIEDWLLPLVGNATGGEVSQKDIFLRLEFCPTGIVPGGYSNPFAVVTAPPASLLRLHPDLTAPASEGEAGDGGGCTGAELLGVGPGTERCAAAGHLLQCSRSFIFLSEFINANLAQGQVKVALVEWAGDLLGGEGRDIPQASPLQGLSPSQAATLHRVASRSAAAGVIAVHLDLDPPFLPLFVTLESPLEGVFLQNGMHLLPWENQTAYFVVRGEGRCSKGGCSPEEREVLLQDFRKGLTVQWLQQGMAGLAKARAEGMGGNAAQPSSAGHVLHCLLRMHAWVLAAAAGLVMLL